MNHTPEEAATLLCPFSRAFASTPANPNCRGPECAVWRWEPLTTSHPKWREAVKAKAEEIGDKVPYAKASAAVAADPEAYGLIIERGRCGAGGA